MRTQTGCHLTVWVRDAHTGYSRRSFAWHNPGTAPMEWEVILKHVPLHLISLTFRGIKIRLFTNYCA